MSLVENTAWPWFKLSVLSEIGLNNAGHRVATEHGKVFRKSVHPLPRPAILLNILGQAEVELDEHIRSCNQEKG